MPLPNAPQSGDSEPILFMIYNLAGNNAAALFRAYLVEAINAENTGHLGVYAASGTLKTGYKVTTASTEIALSSTSIPCDGLVVKADPDNAEDVWVGITGLTVNKTAGTDGYRLSAGESIGIAARNVNTVFIRRGGSVNVGAYFAAQATP